MPYFDSSTRQVARQGGTKSREVFYAALTVVLLLLFAEGVIRVLSLISPIYDLEMIKYALELKRPSTLPGVSHEHIPHAQAYLMGQDVVLNSLGHRSPELQTPKPVQEKRLHFIGNSMILGWGSAEAFTIPSLTAQGLQLKAQAVGEGATFVAANAGVGNYNATASARLFERQVDLVKPDLVVFQYYISDAVPATPGQDNILLRHSMLAAFSYLKFRSIWVIRDETLSQYYGKFYRPDSPNLLQTSQAIQQVQELCAQRKIPLVALLIPEMHDLSENGPYPPLYATIGSLFSRLGIPMVNPVASLRKTFGNRPTAAWVAQDDPHASREANVLIAQELVDHLSVVTFAANHL